jgi:homoserine dehydrogenase
LGYAEADPTGDVEGFDAAYKLTTLSTIAFNRRTKIEDVYREGISKITPDDIKLANELGYKIKLIAFAQIDEGGNADVRVHPMLVSKKETLAHINYVTNAVTITGTPVGKITLSGAGAGEMPTASSVVGDILAICAELNTTDYLLPMMRCKHGENAHAVNIKDTENKYFLRIIADNKVGGIAEISTAFAANKINIFSILMKQISDDNTAQVVIITESCKERDIDDTIKQLVRNGSIRRLESKIRVNS